MAEVLASIIIPTKNGGPEFELTLERCFQQRLDGTYEVMVIDSGSRDGTVERAARRPLDLVQIRPEDFGHGRTRNYGATLARGRFLVYLSQDAIPANASWLAELLRPFQDPQVAGAYSRQVPKDNAHPLERFFLASTYHERPEVRDHQGGVRGRWRVRDGFFSNVSSAIRRDVLLRLPFDEGLIMSEDQQWARDAIAAGYRIVYQPSSVVCHSHGYTLLAAFRRSFDSGASLRDITQDSLADVVGGGLGHLGREMVYLAQHGYWGWLPLALPYEGARFLGFFLGRHARFLPRPLTRRLSQYAWYWK
ncbi:MAG: glycosyltransferase [Chloroflexi bacterium]|nr:glycosyltransferase [Chloroflexota bacterium]